MLIRRIPVAEITLQFESGASVLCDDGLLGSLRIRARTGTTGRPLGAGSFNSGQRSVNPVGWLAF
jgi:hypothetical protein